MITKEIVEQKLKVLKNKLTAQLKKSMPKFWKPTNLDWFIEPLP
jgi:hypothetical protein